MSIRRRRRERSRCLPWTWSGLSLKEEGRLAGSAGALVTRRSGRSHVAVALVLEQVRGDQCHRLAARVLPPMCRGMRLGRDLAGLVDDRHGAVARMLGDLAGDDVDERRTVGMAVPGNDAAGRYDEPAQAELAVLHHGGL